MLWYSSQSWYLAAGGCQEGVNIGVCGRGIGGVIKKQLARITARPDPGS